MWMVVADRRWGRGGVTVAAVGRERVGRLHPRALHLRAPLFRNPFIAF
jgi:hypothetical protein